MEKSWYAHRPSWSEVFSHKAVSASSVFNWKGSSMKELVESEHLCTEEGTARCKALGLLLRLFIVSPEKISRKQLSIPFPVCVHCCCRHVMFLTPPGWRLGKDWCWFSSFHLVGSGSGVRVAGFCHKYLYHRATVSAHGFWHLYILLHPD